MGWRVWTVAPKLAPMEVGTEGAAAELPWPWLSTAVMFEVILCVTITFVKGEGAFVVCGREKKINKI